MCDLYLQGASGEGEKQVVQSHTIKLFYCQNQNITDLTSIIQNLVWCVLVLGGWQEGGSDDCKIAFTNSDVTSRHTYLSPNGRDQAFLSN